MEFRVRLPGGSLLIDNPGVRELAIWGTESGLEDAFSEIHELIENCRFRDCTHAEEPGCAVVAEVENGNLPADRLESFRALQREVRSLEVRRDIATRREEQRRLVSTHKAAKKHKPRR